MTLVIASFPHKKQAMLFLTKMNSCERASIFNLSGICGEGTARAVDYQNNKITPPPAYLPHCDQVRGRPLMITS